MHAGKRLDLLEVRARDGVEIVDARDEIAQAFGGQDKVQNGSRVLLRLVQVNARRACALLLQRDFLFKLGNGLSVLVDLLLQLVNAGHGVVVRSRAALDSLLELVGLRIGIDVLGQSRGERPRACQHKKHRKKRRDKCARAALYAQLRLFGNRHINPCRWILRL